MTQRQFFNPQAGKSKKLPGPGRGIRERGRGEQENLKCLKGPVPSIFWEQSDLQWGNKLMECGSVIRTEGAYAPFPTQDPKKTAPQKGHTATDSLSRVETVL